ncbi:hypothetical protein OG21DRAFT_1505962 [Imleria badia]|nr:hypothetical protein OG21DRAFT_1505962 [Imleria badia]
MSTSHQDPMPSSPSPFAYAIRRCVGFLQMSPPRDEDQVLVASHSPDTESTTLTDMYDAPSPLSSAASSSDGGWNDVASHGLPTLGMVQLKDGFVRLYHLVTALVVKVTVIASDVVSLKDRITAVESTRTPALARDQGTETLARSITALVAKVTDIASDVVSLKDRITAVEGTRAPPLGHGQETEVLARQVNALRKHVVSQEDRIAGMERSQRAETESYRKTIQELTTELVDVKVVDDKKKTRDDDFENLRQSFKNLQRSMECQAARITGVKADAARKIALLQSDLAGVQTELSTVKIIALPADASPQAAKEARRARILASVAQRMEDVEMAEEIEKLCPLPPVVARSSACATACQDMPAASTSPGGSSIPRPNYSKPRETTVKSPEITITKEPLSAARTSVAQPGAEQISAIPIIPKPIPTIPMGRLIIPAKGSGKENKPCNSSTTTLRNTKTVQPGAGRSPDVSGKPSTASPRKVQPSAGLPSKISAVQKHRRSMLPTPRKSQFPRPAQHAVVVDGSSSNEVKTANRLPGGSATQTERPKTVGRAAIATSRSPSPMESPLSTLVERKPPAVLSASSSLASLDAALQAMQLDGDDLLAPMPALSCWTDDHSFSALSTVFTRTQRRRDDKNESIYVPPKQRNVDVKPLRNPLKSTLAANEVSSPAPSSLTALDAGLQSEGDILTLLPRSDSYPNVDLGFSTVIPIFQGARPHCKRESIYVSPIKRPVKPSRRL